MRTPSVYHSKRILWLLASVGLHALVGLALLEWPSPDFNAPERSTFTLDLSAPLDQPAQEPPGPALRPRPSKSDSMVDEVSSQTAGDLAPHQEMAPVSAAKFNLIPEYPEISQQKGEEGRVLVRLQFDKTSQLAGFEILQSSGHRRLDQAVRQLLVSRIQPALEAERAIRVAFDFELD